MSDTDRSLLARRPIVKCVFFCKLSTWMAREEHSMSDSRTIYGASIGLLMSSKKIALPGSLGDRTTKSS